MLTVHLFGGFAVHYDETLLTFPSQTSRSLFAYCAAYADRTPAPICPGSFGLICRRVQPGGD